MSFLRVRYLRLDSDSDILITSKIMEIMDKNKLGTHKFKSLYLG